MSLPKEKPTVVSGGSSKLPTRSGYEPDASLVSYTPQDLLRRLDGDLEQLTHGGKVYTGEIGGLALDILKKVENYITAYRENAKEYLENHPHGIKHYRLETQNRRVVSRDAGKVYEALATNVELSAEDFLPACTPTIAGLNSLFADREGMLPEEVAHTLEHALGDQGLLFHELTKRLVREGSRP